MKIRKLTILSLIVLIACFVIMVIRVFINDAPCDVLLKTEKKGDYCLKYYEGGACRISKEDSLLTVEKGIGTTYYADGKLYYTAVAETDFGFATSDVKMLNGDEMSIIAENAYISSIDGEGLIITLWVPAPAFPVENAYRRLWYLADERYCENIAETLYYSFADGSKRIVGGEVSK